MEIIGKVTRFSGKPSGWSSGSEQPDLLLGCKDSKTGLGEKVDPLRNGKKLQEEREPIM
jgi:hypothetical protein